MMSMKKKHIGRKQVKNIIVLSENFDISSTKFVYDNEHRISIRSSLGLCFNKYVFGESNRLQSLTAYFSSYECYV